MPYELQRLSRYGMLFLKLKKLNTMPSSVVEKVDYDANTSTLRVIFVSGNVYDYFYVPEEVYNEMITAPSKGFYLNRRIKREYAFKRIK